MKAKIFSVVLLSVALIWLIPNGQTPKHKSSAVSVSHEVVTVAQKTTTTDVQPQGSTRQEHSEEIPAVMPVSKPVVIPEQVPQGCATYVPLLQQYDWNPRIMTALMRAESSCNPNAINTHNYDGVYDYGLLQLHGQDILDPATNIAHAYAIWQRQGYHAWSAYNNGSYLRYL